MKRASKTILSVALIVGVAILAAGAAAAQVATMSYGPTTLSWSPAIENEGFVLTVGGNGQYFRTEFKAGESPVFNIFDNRGEPLGDGVYKWELTPVLSRAQIERGDFGAGKTSADSSYSREARRPVAQVGSGTFRILNGSIVDPSAVEPGGGALGGGIGGVGGGGGKGVSGTGGPTTNFVAHTGSVTIDGSLCLGFDCPATATFSDSTLLLTENNTRIKYDDTSVAASFPNNDWELQANSSLNGGGSFFAINDCGTSSGGGCADDPVFKVEAGARANALYVESSGDIGAGTSNPVLDLHLKSGDSPGVRLEQDGSSGFAPQIWDLAGNETSFFIRDATNGSTLPFRIQPGTASNTLFLDADDRVGIGTTSPDQPLHVVDSDAQILVEATGAQAGRGLLRLENAGTTRFEIVNTAGAEWRFQSSQGSNNFLIDDPAVAGSEFELDNDGDLTIAGDLVTGGAGNCAPPNAACDLVFSPDYEVESIKEHAEFMWSNSYLPAVGPTLANQPINLTRKAQGMLNELEKAHIYIEQLHDRVGDLNSTIDAKDDQLLEVTERLARLERALEELTAQ